MISQETDYSPIIEILEDVLGDYKMHNENKGQISFDCPVCSYEIKGLDTGDGKGNLEVNYKYNVYKCWSCSEINGTHGSLYKLIKKYGTLRQLKNYQLLKPDDNEDQPKKVYKQLKLPKDFIPFNTKSTGIKFLPQYKQALSYIKKRNITEEIIDKYNVGFCYDGEYANRIIIPSYDENGDLNYFIARSYLTNARLKYRNPEAEKEKIIFNERLIDWNRPIYIVEGAFDSIFLDNSIPMLGKKISEKLYMKLYEIAKKIIIILDGDAWDDAEKLYHKLNCGKLMGKIWVVKLPKDKDIADLQGNLNNFQIKQLD